MQLAVVWSLPLTAGSEGPYPHLLRSLAASGGHNSLLSAPSWRTIISISFERDVRVFPLHPAIERVVKKKIRQYRADN